MNNIYFFIFAIVLILFFCYVYYRDFLHPTLVFGIFWLFIMLTYIFAHYNYSLYEVSENTVNIIGIGVIVFSTTAAIAYNISVKGTYKSKLFQRNIKKEIVYFMFAIAICYGIILSVRYITLVGQGYDTAYVRSLYGSVTEKGPIRTAFEAIIYSYFFRPIIYCVIVMLPTQILTKNKDKKLIGLLLVLLVVSSTDGGRVTYYNLIFSFIFSYMLLKRNTKKENEGLIKRNIKKIITAIIALVLVMYIVSLVRGVTVDKLFEQVIVYFSGCISFMDIQIAKWPMEMPKTLGYGFFGGLVKFLSWLLSQFGTYFGELWDVVVEYGVTQPQIFTKIGRYNDYNAFVSVFYYFYMDFGYAGVIIGSMIWAIMCAKAYKNINIYNSDMSKYIYILLLIGILNSMVRWPFFQSEYLFAYFYLIICSSKKGNVYEN